jgi:putative hydrolase of the HAD superfamily
MTRTVFFDVDGVLVHGYHSRPERQQRWDETLLADLGIDPERFRHEFIFDVFIKKVIIGQMSLVEALDKRLPAFGYKGSPMTFVDYWLSHDSTLNQPLVDLVAKLKVSGAARLFIATNQEHLRAFWLWETMKLKHQFEDIFYSARFGVLKPTPAYFEAIARRIGPQAEPPLFFDDTPDVIKGAKAFGWEAVLFDDIADCSDHPWIKSRIG